MITYFIETEQECRNDKCSETLRPDELVIFLEDDLFCSIECMTQFHLDGFNYKEVLLTDRKDRC